MCNACLEKARCYTCDCPAPQDALICSGCNEVLTCLKCEDFTKVPEEEWYCAHCKQDQTKPKKRSKKADLSTVGFYYEKVRTLRMERDELDRRIPCPEEEFYKNRINSISTGHEWCEFGRLCYSNGVKILKHHEDVRQNDIELKKAEEALEAQFPK